MSCFVVDQRKHNAVKHQAKFEMISAFLLEICVAGYVVFRGGNTHTKPCVKAVCTVFKFIMQKC